MPTGSPIDHARLSIVFVDACNSTRLYETLGDDAAQQRIGALLDALREAAERHAGRVIKEIGDESMIVFDAVASAIAFARELVGIQASTQIQCKTGMHCGEVIVRGEDVFGDAVNTAARMVALATPGQVLMSLGSIESLPPGARPEVRELPPFPVRGKRTALRLVELLQEQHGDYTQVVDEAQLASLRSGLGARLRLQWAAGSLQLESRAAGATLGREPGNTIAVALPQVSRAHARIEHQAGYWLLRDHSTNGTQLQEQGARPVLLRHEQQRLVHAGSITLAPGYPSEIAVIRYAIES